MLKSVKNLLKTAKTGKKKRFSIHQSDNHAHGTVFAQDEQNIISPKVASMIHEKCLSLYGLIFLMILILGATAGCTDGYSITLGATGTASQPTTAGNYYEVCVRYSFRFWEKLQILKLS